MSRFLGAGIFLLRHIKAGIWAVRLERWEELHRSLVAKPQLSEGDRERLVRLEWKMKGARTKIHDYTNSPFGGG